MKSTSPHPFKIQESRRFILQLANNISDILYVADLEKMRTVFINERATELLGNKDQFLEVLNPADSLARMKHFEECEHLADHQVKEIDVRLKVKNGNWRWFRIRDFAFKRNISGTVYQIIGIARDVHEQKLAETVLEVSMERIKEESRKAENSMKLLQSVFDTVPADIQVYRAIRDQQNKIIDFRLEVMNHSYEPLRGSPVQKGKTFSHNIPGLPQEYFINSLIRTVEGDMPGEDIIHYHNNGCDKWHLLKYKKIDDGVMITQTDITETKKTKDKLEECNHFIEQITNTTTDIIYIFDLKEKCIVFTNERAAQILGYSVNHIYSQGVNIFPQILHPDDFERRMEHMQACKTLKDNEIKEIDIRLKIRNEAWHWFRIRDKAFKRDGSGNVIQTIGIGRDIHEQNLITLAIKGAKMQIGN